MDKAAMSGFSNVRREIRLIMEDGLKYRDTGQSDDGIRTGVIFAEIPERQLKKWLEVLENCPICEKRRKENAERVRKHREKRQGLPGAVA